MATMSYGRAMSWLADREPERIAIVHGEREITRGELDAQACRLARDFARRGVGEGDLVTIALPNSIEFLRACLAIWKLGATPQPVSSRLPERERRAIVALAEPALIIGAPLGEYGPCETLPPGFEPDGNLSDRPLPECVPRHARALSSGGSTGRPKLIIDLSPASCDPDVPENGMVVGGTTLVPGPLYHAGPFITAWQALLSGGRVILLSRFDASLSLELIESYGVDWVLFVPTMMQRIWRLPRAEREGRDLSSLRRVMCTGAPSPPWLKRAWIDWLGADRIYEAYGGSERIAGTQISGREWLEHPGSVGRPGAGRTITILDEAGKPCGPGEIGEVYMMPAAGPGTTYRYVGDEARTDAEGWESLGDLGYFDEDGYLYLVDRKTDMILSGGVNVYPAEVEAALDAHPEVCSSVVIGLPDDDLGQRVHAIVEVAKPFPSAALRAHLEEHLVAYKIPRSFEFVTEPLRDDAGKVRRSALREARLASAGDDVALRSNNGRGSSERT